MKQKFFFFSATPFFFSGHPKKRLRDIIPKMQRDKPVQEMTAKTTEETKKTAKETEKETAREATKETKETAKETAKTAKEAETSNEAKESTLKRIAISEIERLDAQRAVAEKVLIVVTIVGALILAFIFTPLD